MMRRTISQFVFAASVSAATFGSSPGFAAKNMGIDIMYPGASCNGPFEVWNAGAVKNSSGVTQAAVCPVPRGHHSVSNNFISKVEVYTSSGTVDCTLRQMDGGGSSHYVIFPDTIQTFSNGTTKVHTFNNLSVPYLWSLVAYCLVAPGERVNAYIVRGDVYDRY